MNMHLYAHHTQIHNVSRRTKLPCVYVCVYVYLRVCDRARESVGVYMYIYGVSTIIRLLKITGLFCRIQSLL